MPTKNYHESKLNRTRKQRTKALLVFSFPSTPPFTIHTRVSDADCAVDDIAQ